jgi:exonuclease SbcC
MRILEVRFKNLNSLVGEWRIDFTHPAYTADGIFAITGPTGAGKTTILDAVCLALYGRTPRLERINKNDNEIMARHTGECFAEACFETRAGRFRCHWSQHRARKRPGGELQNPRHEIINEDTGEVLESKIREVALAIEAVTGMDFGRFTRSMLLAQGGFAAFLQAQPDERAPILEQITGTEIYSRISIKVHQRRGEERKILEDLEAGMAYTQLLSPEEEQGLNNDLQNKLSRAAEAEKRVGSLKLALAWLEGIDALTREIALLETERQEWQEQWQGFSPDLIRLNRADRARALETDYERVLALREQQRQETGMWEAAKQELPEREAEVERLAALSQVMAGQEETAQAGQKSEAEKAKTVRALDIRLSERQRRMEQVQTSIAGSRKQHLDCRQSLAAMEETLQKSDARRLELETYLEQHAADAGLVEKLAVIERLSATLQEKDNSYRHKFRELTAAAAGMQSLQSACEELAAAYEVSSAGVDRAEQEYRQINDLVRTRLKGRELNAWRQELEALQQKHLWLQQGQSSKELIGLSREKLTGLRRQADLLQQEIIKISGDIADYDREVVFREREINHLNKELALLNRIHSLEEERRLLRDGEVCPLCGAVEHPFAQGNIPALQENELALRQAQEGLNQARNRLLQVQLKQAELHKDREQNGRDINDEQGRLETEIRRWQEVTANLKNQGSLVETHEQLGKELELNRQQTEFCKEVIAEVEAGEKTEKNAYQAWDEIRRAHLELDRSLQEARFKQKSAEQEHARLLKEKKTGEEELNRIRHLLGQETEPWGIKEPLLPDLAPLLDQLRQRRSKWQEALAGKAGEEKNIADLKAGWGRQEVRLAQLDQEIQNGVQEYEQLAREYNALRQQRLELYGDKDPDREEKRCLEAVEEARENLEGARRKKNQAEQELNHLQVRLASLSDSVQKRAGELTRQEEAWQLRLLEAGFRDEADYQAAVIQEEDKKRLQQEAELLRREESELTIRWQDRNSRLKAEKEKMLSDEPYERLQNHLESAIAVQNDLQQEIYALNHSLAENQKRRTEQEELLKVIAGRKKECARWELLHELIGSADGKKYRNFAQGLTFEVLVGHANRQLQKMSDRYLLIRDQGQPLELNVIDNYQGGEIRSTKNLSGGESFIVSLALALGLSQMASRNVNLDSFFLDEGFGSLDEDALDSALETLAGLQQEGKIIGVISHVPALKERINTQIEVVPQNGGYSRIQGPGCMEIKS